MDKNEEQRQFTEWLSSRMSDAELTDEDRKVFADWVMKEHSATSQHDEKHNGPGVTLHEVREFFSWLKNRISMSSIDSQDKKLMNDWLMQRVKEHKKVDHDELHKLRRELLD